MEHNEVLFEVETLQNWQLEANQVLEEVAPGGASNSNCTNNSADEP